MQPGRHCPQHDQPRDQHRYQIRVEGVLDPGWSEWLDGLAIRQESGEVTLLSGPLRDQAALFGVLVKIRDLGLTLISVNREGESSEQ